MTSPSTLHRRGVDVPTPDGSADAYLVRPAGDAALPGVLLFMDAIGFAPDFPAEVYTAHADEDPSMPPEQVTRLEEALDGAGVTFTSKVYAGAHHGFTMSDMPVYNAAADQRHWDALFGLLDRTVLAHP